MTMTFVRKKRRGQDQRVRRTWFDEKHDYRINWSHECHGVRVPPHFYSCVRVVVNGFEYWEFCGARKPYRTYAEAQDWAERHREIWNRALDGGFRELRSLRANEGIGKGVTYSNPLNALPLWVKREAPNLATIVRALFTDKPCKLPDDDTDPSENCDPSPSVGDQAPSCSLPKIPNSGPVPTATEKAQSGTTKAIRSKATSSLIVKSAPSAKEPAAESERGTSKSTRKPKRIIKSKRKATRSSKRPRKAASAS